MPSHENTVVVGVGHQIGEHGRSRIHRGALKHITGTEENIGQRNAAKHGSKRQHEKRRKNTQWPGQPPELPDTRRLHQGVHGRHNAWREYRQKLPR